MPAPPASFRFRFARRGIVPGLAWLILLLPLWCGARAEASVPLSDLVLEYWSTREGLPHNSINAIAQTPEGYLWLATWEGAARFNGRTFEIHTGLDDATLPDPGLRALRVLRSGELVAGGSRGGLASRNANGWVALPPAPSLVADIFEDSLGRLWLGTDGRGVVMVEPDGTRRSFGQAEGLPGDTVYAFTQAGDGRVWIGTNRGLAFHHEGRIQTVPGDGLPPVPVTSLAQATDGRGLLVGTHRGLWVGHPTEAPLTVLDPALATIGVTQLLAGHSGELWIGTHDRGLLRLSDRGLESLTESDGLPNNRVTALFEDQEGSVWVGTNGGLLRLGQGSFSTLTKARGLAGDYVRAVVEDARGILWVGTSSGVSRVEGDRIDPVGTGTILEGRSVLSLATAPDGSLWVGTLSDGAIRWRDGRVLERVSSADGLPTDEVRAILAGPGREVWFGTSEGLAQRAADGRISAPVSDLPDSLVTALHRDRSGKVWVGTSLGAAFIADGRLVPMPFKQAAGAQFVFGFHEPDGDDLMWLATDRGLLRLRPSDGEARLVDPRARLPLIKVFSVLADDDGYFWLAGNRGVMRMPVGEAMAAADGGPLPSYTLFDEADGMLNAQTNGASGPAAVRRADGSLAFATAKGIATVHPRRLSDSRKLQPPVAIESLSADGGAVELSGEVDLPAGTRRVAIKYAGLSFVMPGRIRYRTRLEGFDADWVERGGSDLVEFTNLPPGAYRFEVTAANPNGDWNPVGAQLAFRIEPRFWQRADFWVLATMAGVGALAGGVRMRERRLVRSELRLRKEVDQRTRELSEQAERLRQADAAKAELMSALRHQARVHARQAREDSLTGVSNRRAFDEILARELARTQRAGTTLCIALLDLDHFKRVNDDYSHQAGDAALKALAATMLASCREIDYVARIGGEEFAVVLPQTSPGDALELCERIRLAVERMPCDGFAPGLRLTASIGLAHSDGSKGAPELLAEADAALYRAKQGGRNRVCVADAGHP